MDPARAQRECDPNWGFAMFIRQQKNKGLIKGGEPDTVAISFKSH
jgi:hypothetical protein